MAKKSNTIVQKFRFAVGDIVVTAPGYSPAAFVITVVDPSKPVKAYTAVNIATGKVFGLGDRELHESKIGTATDEYMATFGETGRPAMDENNIDFANGRAMAKQMSMQTWLDESEREKWQFLADAKPGDSLTVRQGPGIVGLIFSHVLARGQKFHFVAKKADGRAYKWRIDQMVLIKEAKAKA